LRTTQALAAAVHKAEWATWQSWLDTISNRVTKISGVSTKIEMPDSLSSNAPTLVTEWDASKIGITGQEVSKHLYDTEPRIVLAAARGSRPHSMASSLEVMPYIVDAG
jgi:L-seryl-tRNA(Ser) seleniumtransferase